MKKKTFFDKSKELYYKIPKLKLFELFVTILVGAASIIFAFTQVKLYSLETQPHFYIVSTYGERVENGKYVDREISIFNSGGNFYDLNCSTITFISAYKSGEYILLPLMYYYSGGQKIYSYDSDLIYKIIGYNSNQIVSRLETDFSEKYPNFIEVETYIKIRYQDINGKYITKYFNAKNGGLIDKNYGKVLFSEHDRILELIPTSLDVPTAGININNITIDMINEYINSSIAITKQDLID